MFTLYIIREPVDRTYLRNSAKEGFGDMLKAVVDVQKNIMCVGGELHADEEQKLLEDGSLQEHLWGINMYPDEEGDDWIEFDSMINVRPNQGNRSRSVDDPLEQEKIMHTISLLVL